MATVQELENLGLLQGAHLTDKGRDYLQLLGALDAHGDAERDEEDADLVLSTNALVR